MGEDWVRIPTERKIVKIVILASDHFSPLNIKTVNFRDETYIFRNFESNYYFFCSFFLFVCCPVCFIDKRQLKPSSKSRGLQSCSLLSVIHSGQG